MKDGLSIPRAGAGSFRPLSNKTDIRPRAARTGKDLAMALHFFRINDGKYSGVSELDIVGEGHAAWTEMTKVCSELIGSVSRELKENDEWQIELLDQHKKPVFRIRLMAETLDEGQ